MTQPTEERLINFVRQHAVNATSIERTTDLIDMGAMDSLMLMELVLFVEETWGVCLMGHDFSPSHFRSIERLTLLIEARRLSQSA